MGNPFEKQAGINIRRILRKAGRRIAENLSRKGHLKRDKSFHHFLNRSRLRQGEATGIMHSITNPDNVISQLSPDAHLHALDLSGDYLRRSLHNINRAEYVDKRIANATMMRGGLAAGAAGGSLLLAAAGVGRLERHTALDKKLFGGLIAKAERERQEEQAAMRRAAQRMIARTEQQKTAAFNLGKLVKPARKIVKKTGRISRDLFGWKGHIGQLEKRVTGHTKSQRQLGELFLDKAQFGSPGFLQEARALENSHAWRHHDNAISGAQQRIRYFKNRTENARAKLKVGAGITAGIGAYGGLIYGAQKAEKARKRAAMKSMMLELERERRGKASR